jgi:hypothetical protein
MFENMCGSSIVVGTGMHCGDDVGESDAEFLLPPFTHMHEIAEQQVPCMSRTKNRFGDCYEVFSIHGNVSFRAETVGGGTTVSFKVAPHRPHTCT